jgi:hypothetical protein
MSYVAIKNQTGSPISYCLYYTGVYTPNHYVPRQQNQQILVITNPYDLAYVLSGQGEIALIGYPSPGVDITLTPLWICSGGGCTQQGTMDATNHVSEPFGNNKCPQTGPTVG